VSHTDQASDPLGALLERYLLSGDEEAMDQVVAATRAKLLVVARRIGAPQDAEDAVQGAYLSLLRKRGVALDAPVMPWLLTSVIRLSYRRKAVQGRQRDLARRLAQPKEAPGRAGDTPASMAAKTERGEIVRTTVARLPRIYRDAVVLCHLEGLPTRDVATLLDVPEATVRTRLHRAAKMLKSKVAPVLLGLLLFLPWCAVDAWRGLATFSRPILARPLAASALIGGLLVAAIGLSLSLPLESGGAVAHPDSPVRDAGAVPPAPEEPRPDEGTAPPPPDARPQVPIGAGAHPPAEAGAGAPPVTTDPHPLLPSDAPTTPAGEVRPHDPGPALPPMHETVAVGKRTIAPPPPGMVFLEGGHVPIGTEPTVLDTLLAGRPAEHRKPFLYETPRHRRFLQPYHIGLYEVTNAQYLRFLEEHAVRYDIAKGSLESLDAIAAHLVRLSKSEQEAPRQKVWLQLYRANKGAIWRAFGKRVDEFLVWTNKRTIDEAATARRLRFAPLPPDLVLSFYSIRPPDDWPDMRPPDGRWNHPVRFVTYNDAERCAEWAGLHLPTEFEWEWAARGPEGRRFPWGNQWVKNASRANWGGRIQDEAHETTTLPVDARGANDGEGRSWCGLHHMAGNVAEWTSSWFDAYPGNPRKNSFLGRWVKVLRGGGAGDTEKLVLRSACRNFIGGGHGAPPFVGNRFPWAGFRLAAYRVPGQDQVGPVLRRATRQKKLAEEAFAAERFTGMVTRNWVSPDAQPKDHVYVLGRARAVIFVPMRTLLREQGTLAMRDAWAHPVRFRSTQRLLSQSARAPLPLGALHTDLPLEGLEIAASAQERTPAKKKRGRRREGPPPTETGTLSPGTYVLAVWHGRLAVLHSDHTFAAFLPRRAGPGSRKPNSRKPNSRKDKPSVEVRSHSSKQVGPPTQRLTRQAGEGLLDFVVALGGKTSPEKWQVVVRVRLPYVPDALASPFAWLHSDADR